MAKTNKNNTDDFNYDFINLINERNPNKLLKNIKEEMIYDCTDIERLRISTTDSEVLFDYLVLYVSKYSFFIHHFEQLSLYENCGEIKQMMKMMCKTYFNVTDEFLELMILQSVDNYRLLDKEEKQKRK